MKYILKKVPFVSKRTKRVLLICVLLILVGGLLAFLFRIAFPQIFITKTSPEEQKITHVAAGDGESKWKTYVNTKESFSFPYPASFSAQEIDHGMEITTLEIKNPANRAEYRVLIFPKSLGKLIGQDLEEYYNMPIGETRTITSPTNGEAQQFNKVSTKMVDQRKAFDFTVKTDETQEIGTYIELGDKIFIISTGKNNQQTLDEMITAFTSSEATTKEKVH